MLYFFYESLELCFFLCIGLRSTGLCVVNSSPCLLHQNDHSLFISCSWIFSCQQADLKICSGLLFVILVLKHSPVYLYIWKKNVFCMVALVFNDFVVIIMVQFLPPVHQKLVPCDICFLITESPIVLSVHVNYCKRWHQMIRHCIYWGKKTLISQLFHLQNLSHIEGSHRNVSLLR